MDQVPKSCRKEAWLKTPRNNEVLYFATRRGWWSALGIPGADRSGGQEVRTCGCHDCGLFLLRSQSLLPGGV